jgi:hypothetical protein
MNLPLSNLMLSVFLWLLLVEFLQLLHAAKGNLPRIVSSIPIMSGGVMTNSPYLSLILSIASANAWERWGNIPGC